eukprot:5742012-Alexandrium_andersonii.AAC.1
MLRPFPGLRSSSPERLKQCSCCAVLPIWSQRWQMLGPAAASAQLFGYFRMIKLATGPAQNDKRELSEYNN